MSRGGVVRLALALLVALGSAQASFAAEAVVQVESGRLRGSVEDGIATFRGIPYAAPPTGERRWRPPEPLEAWSDVRAATAYGARCPQHDRMSENAGHVLELQGVGWLGRQFVKAIMAFRSAPPMDEDCLFLNVASGNLDRAAKQPVMVWIHGGGHQNGAGSQQPYGSTALVERGVVQVTINYRIGPLGFFAHPALSAESPHGVSGNYGVLDQIAALAWVRANIAAFGGDPGNVTIFGESAGGHSVGQLMATPLARGSFDKAIAMSGTGTHQFLRLRGGSPGEPSAEGAGVEAARRLGVDDAAEATARVAAALRALSADAWLASTDGSFSNRAYHPAIDGQVFPKSAAAIFAAGEQAAVPFIAGSTSDEGNLFAAMARASGQAMTLLDDDAVIASVADYEAALGRVFGARAARVRALYPATTPAEVEAAVSRLFTDAYFGSNARYAVAMQRALSARAYLYVFDRRPPGDAARFGAIHGSDVQFTFGALLPLAPKNPFDDELAATMGDQLVRFAQTGDPNLEGRPAWPLYDAAAPHWMRWGESLGAAPVSRPRTESYELFDEIRAARVREGD